MSEQSEPLDPEAIMAEHRSDEHKDRPLCIECNEAVDWPCLPYRLAAELNARHGSDPANRFTEVAP